MPAKLTIDSLSLDGIWTVISASVAFALHWFLSLFQASELRPQHNRAAHPYQKPGELDDRAPCPALNALANHGYLPRNGRFITNAQLIRALREGYGLSYPLAALLTIGGHGLLGQGGTMCLCDLARHNCIEHNASLGHADVQAGFEYAPTRCDRAAIHALLARSTRSTERAEQVLGIRAFAEARVQRESLELCSLDSLHSEIAKGECSMVLGIFGQGKQQVPVRWMEDWWVNERLPEDWEPLHEQGLWETVLGSKKVGKLMNKIKPGATRKSSL